MKEEVPESRGPRRWPCNAGGAKIAKMHAAARACARVSAALGVAFFLRDVGTMTLIQVNTDNHIQGSAELAADVESVVSATLGHFADRITRVEVHLNDENAHKGGDRDIRCSMEARVEGLQPMGVNHAAGSLDEAVDGAAEKLKHVIEHAFGRLESR